MATTHLVDSSIRSAPRAASTPRTVVAGGTPWLALMAPVTLALTLLAVIYLSRISF